MLAWIKKKLGISVLEKENDLLKKQLEYHHRYITNKLAELKEYTRVDADIGIRGNNTIILTGIYRKQAYVRFYDIGSGEFERLVEQLRYMKDHCLIRNIDSPPSFSAVFDL